MCFAVGGWRGAAGFALGLFATGFGIAVWWMVVSLIASLARQDAKPQRGTTLVILAFLIKLPLFIAAVFLAFKLGGAARACFGVGLCQVYLALVGRAFMDGTAQPT